MATDSLKLHATGVRQSTIDANSGEAPFKDDWGEYVTQQAQFSIKQDKDRKIAKRNQLKTEYAAVWLKEVHNQKQTKQNLKEFELSQELQQADKGFAEHLQSVAQKKDRRKQIQNDFKDTWLNADAECQRARQECDKALVVNKTGPAANKKRGYDLAEAQSTNMEYFQNTHKIAEEKERMKMQRAISLKQEQEKITVEKTDKWRKTRLDFISGPTSIQGSFATNYDRQIAHIHKAQKIQDQRNGRVSPILNDGNARKDHAIAHLSETKPYTQHWAEELVDKRTAANKNQKQLIDIFTKANQDSAKKKADEKYNELKNSHQIQYLHQVIKCGDQAQKKEKQDIYKNILLEQMSQNEFRRQSENGSMSKEEKRINKYELKAFRRANSSLGDVLSDSPLAPKLQNATSSGFNLHQSIEILPARAGYRRDGQNRDKDCARFKQLDKAVNDKLGVNSMPKLRHSHYYQASSLVNGESGMSPFGKSKGSTGDLQSIHGASSTDLITSADPRVRTDIMRSRIMNGSLVGESVQRQFGLMNVTQGDFNSHQTIPTYKSWQSKQEAPAVAIPSDVSTTSSALQNWRSRVETESQRRQTNNVEMRSTGQASLLQGQVRSQVGSKRGGATSEKGSHVTHSSKRSANNTNELIIEIKKRQV